MGFLRSSGLPLFSCTSLQRKIRRRLFRNVFLTRSILKKQLGIIGRIKVTESPLFVFRARQEAQFPLNLETFYQLVVTCTVCLSCFQVSTPYMCVLSKNQFCLLVPTAAIASDISFSSHRWKKTNLTDAVFTSSMIRGWDVSPQRGSVCQKENLWSSLKCVEFSSAIRNGSIFYWTSSTLLVSSYYKTATSSTRYFST